MPEYIYDLGKLVCSNKYSKLVRSQKCCDRSEEEENKKD